MTIPQGQISLLEAFNKLFQAFMDFERARVSSSGASTAASEQSLAQSKLDAKAGQHFDLANSVLWKAYTDAFSDADIGSIDVELNGSGLSFIFSDANGQIDFQLDVSGLSFILDYFDLDARDHLVGEGIFDSWLRSFMAKFSGIPDNFPSHLRLTDRLITLVSRGTLSPDDASTIASVAGLEFKERSPDLQEFDPDAEAYWTLPMALAWIAEGTPDAAREQCDRFRNERAELCSWKWPMQLRRVTVSDYLASGRTEPEAAERVDAKRRLWKALGDGDIEAWGTNPNGERGAIPAHLWSDLECTGNGRSPEYRSRCSVERYDNVQVLSRAVKDQWAEDHEKQSVTKFASEHLRPRPSHRPPHKRDAVVELLRTFSLEKLSTTKREALLAELNDSPTLSDGPISMPTLKRALKVIGNRS